MTSRTPRKTAKLQLRLPPAQREAIEALASRRRCGLSRVLRDLIEQGLACEADQRPRVRLRACR
jgi:hypothetical protein